VCVELASHAGESIRRIFDSGQLQPTEKDTDAAAAGAAKNSEFGSIVDPQTAADLDFFLYLTPPNFRPNITFPVDIRVLGDLHGIPVADLNPLLRDNPPGERG